LIGSPFWAAAPHDNTAVIVDAAINIAIFFTAFLS
jgi:hypothetical protein